MKRPFFWQALVVSLLAHAGAIWWILPQPQPVATPVRLEITLTAPAGPTDRTEVQPEPTDPPAEDSIVGTDPATPALGVVLPPDPPVSTRLVEPEPPVALNLERPADWDRLIEQPVGSERGASIPVLPFNPALEAALGAVLADKRRRLLVVARGSAIAGVADDAYQREGPRGTELKHDGRCITLVEDRAEPGTRWWAGSCTETRATPLALPPIEYDRVGRAVPD